jgi:protein-S-isoprenylcysteine O-methyltransferase Ste14
VSSHDHANVVAPPPLITLGVIAIGVVLHLLLPLSLLPRDVSRAIGLLLLIASAIPGTAAILYMLRAHTSPLPERPTSALVTDGPFRYTRNPIYLSFVLFHTALAFLLNGLLVLLLVPVLIWALTKGVIEREEAYLTRRFGDDYRQYLGRVRRWL